MDTYQLTDEKGNSEVLELISNDGVVLKFQGKDSKINLRMWNDGSLRIYRESGQVKVSIILLVGEVTKMKIHDKSQNFDMDCSIRANKISMGDINQIEIVYDMLDRDKVIDSISIKIGATK